jgi:hypothetical protein
VREIGCDRCGTSATAAILDAYKKAQSSQG